MAESKEEAEEWRARVRPFLADLVSIAKKHDATIAGCGCCGSPWVKLGDVEGARLSVDPKRAHLMLHDHSMTTATIRAERAPEYDDDLPDFGEDDDKPENVIRRFCRWTEKMLDEHGRTFRDNDHAIAAYFGRE
ncbi:MAG: hypothetical protein B7733_00150 [Myxococcales bacterium FL481]|nr:MAG: hypothetical protein B7733_00150 [Myxococcales bacterium FL481]